MPPCGYTARLWLLLVPLGLFNVVSVVFSGFACLSNPCVHGVCLDDLNTTYSCYCIDGYTGVQCQTNWDECWSSPCQNGGVCIDGVASFNCSCAPGFVGELCEEDFNECESNPCLNNGTCLDATNGYTCTCLPGYSGDHCEIDVAVCNATNETRCSNGGVCVEGPGVSFTCKCRPGWGGFLCENEIDECMSAPCVNGGVCIDLHADYACACLFGFTGRNCEEVVRICENSPCRNGALCLTEEGRPVCYCVPDYHGDLCQYQYDECQLGPRCMNGGTCIDGIDNFTCSCPPNLTGVFCECLIIGNNEFDCSYVSPTVVTFPPSARTDYISTKSSTTIALNLTTDIEKLTTKFALETTEVPNLTVSYSTETESAIPTVFVTEHSTLPPSTAGTELSTVFTYEVSTEQQMSSAGPTVIITNVTTPEAIDVTTLTVGTTFEIESTTSKLIVKTTTPQDESTQITTITTPSSEVSATTEISSTKELLYSTEYAETTSSSTETAIFETSKFPQSTEETSRSTFIIIDSTPMPNVTIVSSTTVSLPEETTSFIYTEDTILGSSVTPFLTMEPRSEAFTTSFSTVGTTVSSEYNFTTPDTISDCTKMENECRNGGTCTFDSNGYRCVCPFDAEGALCQTSVGIRNAAFNGDSYLSHRLANHTNITLEFKAKTLSPDGLLFYSNIDSIYMMLYLERGYLMFKFSCGFQTMLLTEMEIPVNNGFEMNIKTEFQLSKDLKHCDASIRVNSTLKMAGDQIAVINRLVTPVAWLHLGGIPQEFAKNDAIGSGFVGCMKNLKVSGKPLGIFKDAEDGSAISECSSLACLSNPCSNGATCAPKGDSWTCHCRNGYLGSLCELSVCDNNPCLFGGTCLPFTSSGYLCLCPFGKHGHFCENDLEIAEPNFSSTVHGLSSYAAYPIPSGISKSMELQFKFIPSTMDQISILMFLGQVGHHDALSDHLAISFVKGYVMLTWNLGAGARRIFTTRPIDKEKESYFVRLGHFGRRAWLYVEDIGNVTGRAPGNLLRLDVVPLLYLGGHDSFNFSTLPHDLPLHSGFSGCIFDVQLKSGNIMMPLQVTKHVVGRAVGQCDTTECYDQVCHNGGACLHHGSTFMCLCQDGWFGPLCSVKNNPCDSSINKCESGSTCFPLVSGYECDCPIGKTGNFCQNTENLTDVSFSGKRSYISLGSIYIEDVRFNFEFHLRPLSNRGLVLFMGKQTNYLSVTIHSGFLEATILAAKRKSYVHEAVSVKSNKLLALGIWYKVQIGLYGRKVYLAVDNSINIGLLTSGDVLNLSGETLYLGGVPDMSFLSQLSLPSLPIPYTGCIRSFSVDSRHIPLNLSNIKTSRNIADCDGTPCGGDFCENGGTCWLDPNLNPLCLCPEPYNGSRCESVPDCDEKLCKNGGRCLNSKCICTVGWTGVFCGTAIEVKVPKFSGSSYLIVETSGDKKRDLGDFHVKSVYLNFSTAQRDGLLLWSSKDMNFIGIGTERGHLKIAYSANKTSESVIEMPNVGQITDGLWHTLIISFVPFYLELDKNVMTSRRKGGFVPAPQIFTDGKFYLGGVDRNRRMVLETRGIFPKSFQGCIEAFGLNGENVIRDFSDYEGENVDVCSIY